MHEGSYRPAAKTYTKWMLNLTYLKPALETLGLQLFQGINVFINFQALDTLTLQLLNSSIQKNFVIPPCLVSTVQLGINPYTVFWNRNFLWWDCHPSETCSWIPLETILAFSHGITFCVQRTFCKVTAPISKKLMTEGGVKWTCPQLFYIGLSPLRSAFLFLYSLRGRWNISVGTIVIVYFYCSVIVAMLYKLTFVYAMHLKALVNHTKL